MANSPIMAYIPYVIEKSSSGERAYDIYSRLLEERIVFVQGSITSDLANAIIAQLLFLQSTDPKKDIKMYINSPGGEIYAGLAIYDTMQHLQCDVQTIAVGAAASMASVLLAAGTKGKRMALPNSIVLIHQPLGGAQGQASDVEITAKEIIRLKELITEILANHTGQKKEQIRNDSDRDYYMTAEVAQKYGIIDKVISKAKE